MNRNTDDGNRFGNKCRTCGTWSVDNSKGEMNIGGFEKCMDGKERWFTYYWCVNCGNEISISEEDEFNGDGIEDGEIVSFE
tara:strand:- start:32651 stop:32893 length:243 start_codon:yes stop_codon:yes gene_type:complete